MSYNLHAAKHRKSEVCSSVNFYRCIHTCNRHPTWELRRSTFPTPWKDLLWLSLVGNVHSKGNNYYHLYHQRVILLVSEPHDTEVMWCVLFCIWLLSLNIWPVKFFNFIAWNSNPFFFIVVWYSIVWICPVSLLLMGIELF